MLPTASLLASLLAAPTGSPSLVQPLPSCDDVAAEARRFAKRPRELRDGWCTTVVETILGTCGYDLRGAVGSMWDHLEARNLTHRDKLPIPGDLMFMKNTYDANKNGKADEWFSHIGVVYDVDENGTAYVVQRERTAVRTLRINLTRSGPEYNSWFRSRNEYADPKIGAALADELFVGWGRPCEASGSKKRPSVARAPSEAHQNTAAKPVAAKPPSGSPTVAARMTRPTSDESEDVDVFDDLTDQDLRKAERRRERGVNRIRKGWRVREHHIADLSCFDLGLMRNTIFARHGYDFSGTRIEGYYLSKWWYVRVPGLKGAGASRYLTRRDKKNVDLILSFEKGGFCRE